MCFNVPCFLASRTCFREFIRTDDLDEVADVLNTHNQKIRAATGDRAFYAVNETLLTAFEAAQAVTLELNIEVLDELAIALSEFTAVPAVLAVLSLQDLLGLHTQDKFDVVLSEILKIWTVRSLSIFHCPLDWSHVTALGVSCCD